jgi:ribokinase
MNVAAPRIIVAGSLMMDLVVRVPRRPRRGETVFGTGFDMFLGGKGFNQAIAARRMGANVTLIGRVGDDDFGRALTDALTREGIDAGGLVVDREAGTGVAVPLIDPTGDNSIISVPRANMRLTAADVEQAAAAFASAGAVLLQLETSTEASLAAAQLGRRHGAIVLLNTAPAGDVPTALLEAADILIANEIEAAALTGEPVTTVAQAIAAAERLRLRSEQTAIVTLGALGAIVAHAGRNDHVPAYPVDALDATGAGDAFCAALAVRLVETGDLDEALRWGNAAGACAVTRLGAEPSLPRRSSVGALLAESSRTETSDARE